MIDDRTAGWARKSIRWRGGGKLSSLVREGNGPTLLYIPGTWTDAEGALPFLSMLDERLRIVAVDMPGHGASWPVAPDTYLLPDIAVDALALADAAGVERFFVSGHSLGGMASVEMLRLCPGRLLGSIPIEGWTVAGVHDAAFPGGEPKPTAEEQELLARDEARRGASYLGLWTPEQRKTYGTIWRRWDGYEALVHTTVPVLEIWGDRGAPPPSRLAMRIPEHERIEIAWIRGMGHKLTMLRPREVAALVDGFIHQWAAPRGAS